MGDRYTHHEHICDKPCRSVRKMGVTSCVAAVKRTTPKGQLVNTFQYFALVLHHENLQSAISPDITSVLNSLNKCPRYSALLSFVDQTKQTGPSMLYPNQLMLCWHTGALAKKRRTFPRRKLTWTWKSSDAEDTLHVSWTSVLPAVGT